MNIKRIFTGGGCCHTDGESKGDTSSKKIALVGNPNVGKSVIFNALTNRYVNVSNYPGTTVEVSRGKAEINGKNYEVIDTPGMYSLLPITEEERVSRRILLKENPDIVVHIIDAKNLERMLPLTLQLIEAHLPTILVLNMMDEAQKEGIVVNTRLLEEELGIPVISATATEGKGINELKKNIEKMDRNRINGIKLHYSIEENLKRLEQLLNSRYSISKRTVALLLLQDDGEIKELVKEKEPDSSGKMEEIIEKLKRSYINPISYELALERQGKIQDIVDKVVITREEDISFRERLSRLMMNPLTGLPFLFLILWWGLYKFVGEFGAGTVVDFLEGTVFGEYINPLVKELLTSIIPWQVLQSLFIGEYGLITLGVRYAVAIIMPIVTFFFIVFSIIEDTGYLPRLAMLIDRTFKKIGLSGRAVIPMVLGFGCDTMAVMVTRILPTKRERIISTMLLALAVPCSAQLGVILALLGGRPKAMLIWAGVIALIFLFIGFLTAKVLPGERPSFYMELPPLRLPKISNVLTKTYVRVKWYFKEVLPLFLLASILIWLGQITHLFDIIINILQKPVGLIGLPPETAKVFLFGFFRRDYGIAGLYDLNKGDILTGTQLVTASVALTLFLPCIAQFLMNLKERGWKTGVSISIFILLLSFVVAYLLNLVLTNLGLQL